MKMRSYKSEKGTQSYADILKAVGIADLIAMLPCYDSDVTITDDGNSYILGLTKELDTDWLDTAEIDPGYRYIIFKAKDREHAPENEMPIEYEEEKSKEEVYREYDKARDANKTIKDLYEQDAEPPQPIPELPLLKIFNSLRANSPSYNNLHIALRNQKDLHEILRLRLEQGMEEADRSKQLTKAASNLQLFNPIAGKGIHRAKPNGTGLGSINLSLVDWFDEWMKFRAMFHVMSGFRDSDTDDFKVFVLAPQAISFRALKEINTKLQKQRLWGSVKTEIGAVMTVVRILIEHCGERTVNSRVRFDNRSPREIIAGLYQVLFKSMGTGRTVMNISFIGLPGWFKIGSAQDAENWLAIFEEHRKIVMLLDEKSILPEEVPLLQIYRDFISSGNFAYLLNFLAGYASLLLRKLAMENKPVKQFTIENLRRVFMSSENVKLMDIVKDIGFSNVASAIRGATVELQRKKARKERVIYEIRYGLAQDWKRKAKFKEQFISTLSAFSQDYNYENNRARELRDKLAGHDQYIRNDITTEDLAKVLHLIDVHGSELVCMLLLAFGYASDYQKKEGDDK